MTAAEGSGVVSELSLPSLLDGSEDAVLLARAVKNARGRQCRKGAKHPRWVAVMDQFALGSNYAGLLCRRFGLDPNEEVSR